MARKLRANRAGAAATFLQLFLQGKLGQCRKMKQVLSKALIETAAQVFLLCWAAKNPCTLGRILRELGNCASWKEGSAL